MHEPRHVSLELVELDLSISICVDFVRNLGPSFIVNQADAVAKDLSKVIRINFSILVEIQSQERSLQVFFLEKNSSI